MGNEQSSMRLTEEERTYWRKKGYDDFGEKCRPIDAANAAKRERRQLEQETRATKQPVDQSAEQRKAAGDAEAKKESDKAAAEKAAAKVKTDREAADRQAAEDRRKDQARKEAATARRASEKEALEQRLAVAQESVDRSNKEAQQARLREKFRKTELPARPTLDKRAPPPPSRPGQQQAGSPNSSDSDDYLAQWGARKERRPVDSPLEKTNGAKSTDEDTLFVSARAPSRQTSTSSDRRPLTVDTSTTAPRDKASTVHAREPESSGATAARTVSDSSVSPRSAKPSLANNRKPSQSSGAAPTSAPAAGIKRPLPITNLSSLGPIAKKPRTTMSTSESPRSPPQNSATGGLSQPDWYSKLKGPVSLAKGEGDIGVTLGTARECITKAKDAYHGRPVDQPLNYYFGELRRTLHALMFTRVNERLLRHKHMLHAEKSLPQIFDKRYDEDVKWPEDIKADAEELYQKWRRRDFDTDIMRGIDFVMAGQQGGDKVQPGAKRDSRRAGHNGLVNGQWWPTLVCAVRDGAHGAMVAGIAGEKDTGAYSCFISGGGDNSYPDIDEGEVVKYCGTDSTNGEISSGTQLMLESMKNAIPVRFIRSSKAKNKSKYAPPLGFRYDGLYDVKDYEILDKKLHRHRFTLVRQPGQAPIRAGEGPEARPTEQERNEYLKHKRLAGGK